MNNKTLKEAFEQVKREIFPLWDRNSLWKVSDKIEESYMGRCNDDNKIIEINLPRVLDIIELKSVLCHEICHAIASIAHGNKWKNRYFKAADDAEKNGDKLLADMIRKELSIDTLIVTKKYVDQRIEDIIMDFPDISFEQLIESLPGDLGVPRSYLNRFSMVSLKKVFNREKDFFKEL